MTSSSREGGQDFGMHVTPMALKSFPTDAGFVHQWGHQTDLVRQGFGMVDDCWIRSRLGKRDKLRGGNVRIVEAGEAGEADVQTGRL